MLTLLCLIFEEIADFPINRSELYQEAVDILLRKWDAERGIQRNQISKKYLPTQEDLLSQIAWNTFVKDEYFFKQKVVEQQISDYISHWGNMNIDSQIILKSLDQDSLLVERAKGIYSFSHITFQEYFVAKKIVDTPPHQIEEVLQKLVIHIEDKRWQEIFLLTVEMLPSADYLLQLMKGKIEILSIDELWILLKNCLNSDCSVSLEVRKEIEYALFNIPIV